METSALLMMLVTEVSITLITVYFFWKVLKTPPKPDTDTVSEN